MVLCAVWAAGAAIARAEGDTPPAKPATPATSQDKDKQDTTAANGGAPATPPAATPQNTTPSVPPAKPAAKPKFPPYAEALDGATALDGMIRLHRKDARLLAELAPGDLNRDFIVIISIARGIGRGHILGGMSLGFGDDWVWQFRKVDDRVQIVRRNVRFRAQRGSPEERAVQRAYTDSVLFSLPIVTMSPAGNIVIDVTPVFMSDLPQISSMLRGFSFSADKSTWASIKAFRDNIEIQVAACYASSGQEEIDTVADSRSATINVHYSISRLPETGYEPRQADDRMGHFLTVVKDYSKASDQDRFVRYVNRWDLRKSDPSLEVSPPRTPIIFWIEKTVPFAYRAPIREGILEWNKAFEKAGFSNAIEVRQQPADADWDPEDINYNTFRWITASAAFAMGPSRVNPLTGQILDADIIFDADFLQGWKNKQEAIAPRANGAEASLVDPRTWRGYWEASAERKREGYPPVTGYASGLAEQLAFGAAVLAPGEKPLSKELMDKLILEGIRSVAVHEVGHTLGLRHNFKGSGMYTIEELSDPAKTKQNGLGSSVMDYLPMNISPKGQPQGEYFNNVLGPWDYWTIEYAYKPLSGGTEGELAQLKKIASRCAEPALDYATDEDCDILSPDPLAARFDLGKDPMQYARRLVQLVQDAMPQVVERMTAEGDGYQSARRAFGSLMGEYAHAMDITARFVGGVYVRRDHKGDPNARPPFALVEAARQREAMDLLAQQIFSPDAIQIPPQIYNYLAPSFWHHWGAEFSGRPDYPVHQAMLMWQDRILGQLLSSLTLSRLEDGALKTPADQDVFTSAELIKRLSGAIFAELDKLQPAGEYTNRKPAVTSLRRNLQRRLVERLCDLALGNTFAPRDCQGLAAVEIEAIEARLKQALATTPKLDDYTRSHFSETSQKIRKVLEARIERKAP